MQKFLLSLILTVAVASGCGPRFGVPNWSSPGPADIQRFRAERFDPYPEVVSRSEMTGVRPREYEKPESVQQEPRIPDFLNVPPQ
ncbi:MAG: hypothetical protein JW888_00585 [Pirellulales bacterium]|nr:hypothetical protein [Pirellulales bacterium]